jgi:hypothetical protein
MSPVTTGIDGVHLIHSPSAALGLADAGEQSFEEVQQ